MLIAHLSDLHLRDAGDVATLRHQLAHIVARRPRHVAITGDILDRWNPDLLERVLDALADHGLLDADRLTLLHGNHDLASSGGHPRRTADLVRLAVRFWDPPPLVAARRRRFYAAVAARAANVASVAPYVKMLSSGIRVAVVDTVPVPWRPLRLEGRTVVVRHALGCIRSADVRLLERLEAAPTLLLAHHYPLDAPQFTWAPDHRGRLAPLARVIDEVRVPMSIPVSDRERLWRAAKGAGVRLVLCGHVHRARLEWHDGIAVGLNGQSGAAWAGWTVASYELGEETIRGEFTRIDRGAASPQIAQ